MQENQGLAPMKMSMFWKVLEGAVLMKSDKRCPHYEPSFVECPQPSLEDLSDIGDTEKNQTSPRKGKSWAGAPVRSLKALGELVLGYLLSWRSQRTKQWAVYTVVRVSWR